MPLEVPGGGHRCGSVALALWLWREAWYLPFLRVNLAFTLYRYTDLCLLLYTLVADITVDWIMVGGGCSAERTGLWSAVSLEGDFSLYISTFLLDSSSSLHRYTV